jgi:transposase-like protein
MNETELTIEDVRRAMGESTNTRGYRTFTKAAHATVVKFALNRIEAGSSAGEVADELGLKGWTLQRWLQNHRRDGGPGVAGFQQLKVKDAPTKRALVVRGACGVTIDGLTVDEVARLLRELSCSA